MKEVLILTKGFYGGGTEVALNSMLKKLDYKRYHVTICCINKRGPLLDDVPSNVEIKEISFTDSKFRNFVSGVKEENKNIKTILWKVEKRIFQKIFSVKEDKNKFYEYILRKTIKDDKQYDIVLDFHGYGYFLTAYASRVLNAKKKVMWIHDQNLHWISNVKEYLNDFDKFFCVSKAVKKDFVEKCPQYAKKTDIFYNQIDTDKIKKLSEEDIDFNVDKNKKILLTIGRLEYQKGYEYVIETASLLKKRGIDFIWQIIGNGNEEEKLKQLVEKNNLNENIIFMGYKGNVYPYLKKCDVYVQPSRHEGFGLALLEAKILKKPIVASNIPCFHEQIVNEANGFLVDLNPKSFEEKIEIILYNERVRNDIIENLSQERFDFSDQLNKLEEL